MKTLISPLLLCLSIAQPLLAHNPEQSIRFDIGTVIIDCTLGETRNYSRSNLTQKQQVELADRLLKVSYRICEAQRPTQYQEKIDGVCLGHFAHLSMVIQYRCMADEAFEIDSRLSGAESK